MDGGGEEAEEGEDGTEEGAGDEVAVSASGGRLNQFTSEKSDGEEEDGMGERGRGTNRSRWIRPSRLEVSLEAIPSSPSAELRKMSSPRSLCQSSPPVSTRP